MLNFMVVLATERLSLGVIRSVKSVGLELAVDGQLPKGSFRHLTTFQ